MTLEKNRMHLMNSIFLNYDFEKKLQVGEMAHWIKAFAAKLDDLSSSSLITHMVEGEEQFTEVVL